MSDAELLPVLILGVPVGIYGRASEHSDELLREFALIREDGSDHVPSRLLAVIEELSSRFSGFARGPTEALQEAVANGDPEIDLEYLVPADLREGVIQLGALLDEADAFCRAGDLLTLATAEESVAFRRWFLDEFVWQIEGNPPRPWSSVVAGRRPG